MSGGNGRGEKYSAASGNPDNTEGTGGYNSGMVVFSYIIGGIVVWSLIGWGLDILLGTHWMVLAGALIGLAGGFYLSFARRFGMGSSKRVDGPPTATNGQGPEQH
ncbi:MULTISPECIES: hypothetical protein [unclassified Arthrobacter]|uniref:AtpZ/AtpI family protein n=1 Tax=unclassified Arthrobacter TaxID=235627 RepID=UPI00159E34E4|nr:MULTISPECIES: hypothetical protein [unclassified Arthrobacter]MCQ9163298.1 hypothetical protein [Arthrobacter sp. STN4]NVM98854.1 hypothetical protein [Arthrobacter sp. SDTb3-6]